MGKVEFRLGKNRSLVAKPGDRVLVPAGTPHRFRNVGEETAHFTCEVRPALGFEELIETMFWLAADGKVNRKGMPNPLRLAVIARHHFGDVRLPFPPAWRPARGRADGAERGAGVRGHPTRRSKQMIRTMLAAVLLAGGIAHALRDRRRVGVS